MSDVSKEIAKRLYGVDWDHKPADESMRQIWPWWGRHAAHDEAGGSVLYSYPRLPSLEYEFEPCMVAVERVIEWIKKKEHRLEYFRLTRFDTSMVDDLKNRWAATLHLPPPDGSISAGGETPAKAIAAVLARVPHLHEEE